jgi:hypothetical protein
MKSEEAIAGYFCWEKLLRKARAHVGLLSNDDDDDDFPVKLNTSRRRD